MLTDLKKFNSFCKDRNEFSRKTFGTPEERSSIYPLQHLQEEINEVIEEPTDPMEWADCFLLFLDAAWRQGHSVDDLVEFGMKKLEINKKRKWNKSNDGHYRHVE
jgi:hypothetical protein